MQVNRERSDEGVRNVHGQNNTMIRTEMEIYMFNFFKYTGDCSTESLLN
jgi:hypothetical protein